MATTQKKAVLSFNEYIAEKKNIDQQMAKGTPEKGKTPSKQVDPNVAKLPSTKGKNTQTTVKPQMAEMPKAKGSVPSKMVKTGTTTLPEKKGSVPSKQVATQTSDLTIKGKGITKEVKPQMANLPIGKVIANKAVAKTFAEMTKGSK